MSAAPHPANEDGRLEALADSGALSLGRSPELDAIVGRAADAANAPIALVSFISSDSQWIKASVGLRCGEAARDSAFCTWAVYSAEVLWVEDALSDARFCDNPLVQGHPNIRHYAGAPILTPEGYALGTICVLDTKPRPFDAATIPMLRGLAGEVSQTLHGAADQDVGRRGAGL